MVSHRIQPQLDLPRQKLLFKIEVLFLLLSRGPDLRAAAIWTGERLDGVSERVTTFFAGADHHY